MKGRSGWLIVNRLLAGIFRKVCIRRRIRKSCISQFFLAVVILLAGGSTSFGQRTWDGEGGDGQWNNPINWKGDSLPVPGQEVILDNSVVHTSYEVVLPADSQQVDIARLSILPQPGIPVRVRIPKDSKFSPALILTASGYSLLIGKNGVFENASGASSGITIDVGDSVRIENGGHYIHRTPRSHAALVSVLSRGERTEKGIFEFDIPSASTTIALTDRVFGSLVLSSTAAGGFINYTAAGTRRVMVSTDLSIQNGARLNLNFSDTFRVGKSLKMEHGFLNLASNTRSLVMMVGDSLLIDDSSSIVSTGSGTARMILSGDQEQEISCTGIFEKDISLVINNPNGVRLLRNWDIKGDLYLEKGRLLSSDATMLVLSDSANLFSDSLQMDTFVEGPLRIAPGYSRDHLLLPVGADGSLRWMAVNNFSGDITLNYNRSSPLDIYTTLNGLDHLSRVEYWSVQNNSTLPSECQAELSFVDASSGGVTDMNSLTVAGTGDGEWLNRGRTSWTGSAGSSGSVTSNVFNLIPGEQFLTLAGTQPAQNPLPLTITDFRYTREDGLLIFNWSVSAGSDFIEFQLQSRKPGNEFRTDTTMLSMNGRLHYELRIELNKEIEYRLLGLSVNGVQVYSRSVYIMRQKDPDAQIIDPRLMGVSRQGNNLRLHVESPEEGMIEIFMYSNSGELIFRQKAFLTRGTNKLICETQRRRDSIYHIFGVFSKRRTNTISLVF